MQPFNSLPQVNKSARGGRGGGDVARPQLTKDFFPIVDHSKVLTKTSDIPTPPIGLSNSSNTTYIAQRPVTTSSILRNSLKNDCV